MVIPKNAARFVKQHSFRLEKASNDFHYENVLFFMYNYYYPWRVRSLFAKLEIIKLLGEQSGLIINGQSYNKHKQLL